MSNRARTPEVREAELAMAAAAGVRGLRLDALAEHAARELGVARTRFAPGPTEPTPYWEAPLEHWSRRPRRASSSDAGVANRFLAEHWMPFWNERFAVAAAEPLDAHRLVAAGKPAAVRPGSRVVVERHLSSELHFRRERLASVAESATLFR